ncbi:protein of unknown function [Pseudomonas inefficax]|uniref:Uncharacterized protein n=1 Tax=Pseudomonas inefficax TaxID=2078786 RepID=A0AAQ1P926_9PSED|nr:protein of unknown function [Pseudomonas inefficax]
MAAGLQGQQRPAKPGTGRRQPRPGRGVRQRLAAVRHRRLLGRVREPGDPWRPGRSAFCHASAGYAGAFACRAGGCRVAAPGSATGLASEVLKRASRCPARLMSTAGGESGFPECRRAKFNTQGNDFSELQRIPVATGRVVPGTTAHWAQCMQPVSRRRGTTGISTQADAGMA